MIHCYSPVTVFIQEIMLLFKLHSPGGSTDDMSGQIVGIRVIVFMTNI